MKKQTIVITSDLDGNLVFDAVGFKGVGCVDAVAKVVKAAGLDDQVTSRKNKADFHKKPTEKRTRLA